MEGERGRSRVLVVDDDPPVADGLWRVLTTAGYEVRTAAEGRHALASFSDWRPGLVMTDLRMAPMDGLELCRRIRAESTVPIIVVSGDSLERSKVAALDSGADDYIVKPFGPDELIARVRAALRRATPQAADLTLDEGDFRVDFGGRRVYARDNEVRLTPKEFDLFVYFARRANRVIPRAQLLSGVWGHPWRDRHEYLRVFVRQLRIKFEEDPSNPRYFTTEPWVGYRFNPGGPA